MSKHISSLEQAQPDPLIISFGEESNLIIKSGKGTAPQPPTHSSWEQGVAQAVLKVVIWLSEMSG